MVNLDFIINYNNYDSPVILYIIMILNYYIIKYRFNLNIS